MDRAERRLRAAERALKKQREKAGMFADQFVTETAPERIARLDRLREENAASLNQFNRQSYLEGGRLIRQLPQSARLALLTGWKASPVPSSSEYFLDFIHHFDLDRWQARQGQQEGDQK